MTAVPEERMSFADYIAFEGRAELRHEYEAGQIFAMAGGTPEHAALALALGGIVSRQVTGTCRGFSETLRIHTPSGKAAYPDIVIVCGPLERDVEDKHTATNPKVVFEILSESTEACDRGKKFAHYRSCESFSEYVLVATQGEPSVERFSKRNGVWTIAETAGVGQQLRLDSVDLLIDVDELYRGLVNGEGVIALQ